MQLTRILFLFFFITFTCFPLYAQSEQDQTLAQLSRSRAVLQTCEAKLEQGALALPPAEEDILLGHQWINDVVPRLNIIETPPYIQKIFNLVTKKFQPSPYTFRLIIFYDPEMTKRGNSYPDGTILLPHHTLLARQNEADLAGLFAHEIVHTLQRHVAEHSTLRKCYNDHGGGPEYENHLFDNEQNPSSIIFQQQERADRGAIDFLTQNGYNPCMLWNKCSLKEPYRQTCENLLREKTCEGKLFIFGTEGDFFRFKKEFAEFISAIEKTAHKRPLLFSKKTTGGYHFFLPSIISCAILFGTAS